MPGPETPALALLAGVALLVAGRRLFWLFVGLVGTQPFGRPVGTAGGLRTRTALKGALA